MNRRPLFVVTAMTAKKRELPRSPDVRSPLSEIPAGEEFKLKVELATPASIDLTISFEKQRVIPRDDSGTPKLRPTGSCYFADGKSPKPIAIKRGRKTAEGEPILVRKDAKAEEDETVLEFPEALLLVAYLPGTNPLREESYSLVLNVLPASG